MTHTKRPWRITKQKDKHEYLHIEGQNSYGGCCPVADVCITENKEANARLIAAAPELLEVCELLLNCSDNDICPICKERIKQAIARAEGR